MLDCSGVRYAREGVSSNHDEYEPNFGASRQHETGNE
jgi:hypothetical protein